MLQALPMTCNVTLSLIRKRYLSMFPDAKYESILFQEEEEIKRNDFIAVF
jgi:hypothetical protein